MAYIFEKISPADRKKILSDADSDLKKNRFLLFSGKMLDGVTKAWDVAAELINQSTTKIFDVGSSEIGKLLDSLGLINALQNAAARELRGVPHANPANSTSLFVHLDDSVVWDAAILANSGLVFNGTDGDDVIDTGHDRNLPAFDKGDGQDTLVNSKWGNDTVSLGQGIRYADLKLLKAGNDLMLGMGQGDSMTLKNWYDGNNSQDVETLQVITLGADYDANAKGWAVMNSLLDAHLQGSNIAALGGDLSYQYATSGSLAGIGLGADQASLAAGTDWQNLKSRSQLEQGSVRLMG